MPHLTAHKSTIFTTIVPFLALAVFAAGCGSMALLSGRFVPPSLRLMGSKITALTAQSAAVLVYFEVTNSNPYPLHAGDLGYRLTVGDSVIAQGTSSSTVSVAAGATAAVVLPVDLSVARLIQEAAAGVMLGEIPYTLEAKLSVGSLFFQREVAVTESSVLLLNLPLGLANQDRSGVHNPPRDRAGT